MVNIETLIGMVSDKYRIPTSDLSRRTRKREIVEPRQVCHMFAFKVFRLPNSKIIPLLGAIDHATIIHSCKVVGNMYATNKAYRERINGIGRNLNISEDTMALIVSMKKSELAGRWDTCRFMVGRTD